MTLDLALLRLRKKNLNRRPSGLRKLFITGCPKNLSRVHVDHELPTCFSASFEHGYEPIDVLSRTPDQDHTLSRQYMLGEALFEFFFSRKLRCRACTSYSRSFHEQNIHVCCLIPQSLLK